MRFLYSDEYSLYALPSIVPSPKYVCTNTYVECMYVSTESTFVLNIRCGHVVRDFESEAKTR